MVVGYLLGLTLGCGATSHDGTPRGDGGSPAADAPARLQGGQPSSNGGVATEAGAGGQCADSAGRCGARARALKPVRLAGGTGGVAGIGGVAGAGGIAGTGGVAGTGGSGQDPNKIVLFDGSPETFNNWYPRNAG
jgi:hypothetical protein